MKKSIRLAKKSFEAALLAIEIYNKPNIMYREETFAILMINAYEMLFKAKLIDEGSIRDIYKYNDGKIKKNRIGQPITINIVDCYNKLKSNNTISQNVINNISVLLEVRDNSIHFYNDKNICNILYSVCVASLSNYHNLISEWFNEINLNKFNFYISPICFNEIYSLKPISNKVATKNLINYIESLNSNSDKDDSYNICMNLNIELKRANLNHDVIFQYDKGGIPLKVELDDEQFMKTYPLTYREMLDKFKRKYPKYKLNRNVVNARMRLIEEECCCKKRYLKPNNQGGYTVYYNSNFIKKWKEEVDKLN